jgi:hypothetical protein
MNSLNNLFSLYAQRIVFVSYRWSYILDYLLATEKSYVSYKLKCVNLFWDKSDEHIVPSFEGRQTPVSLPDSNNSVLLSALSVLVVKTRGLFTATECP